MSTQKDGCGYMKDFTLGFIGAGNMNQAILNGVLGQGMVQANHIWISNPHIEKLVIFESKGIHITTSNQEVAVNADIIILGIKPQMFVNVLHELAGITDGKCVVSIAAGISSAYLQKHLPGTQIIRAMPNTPLMIGVGATAIAKTDDVAAETFQTVMDLFVSAGIVAEISESQMDDIINVNGSSPAWFFRMADIMVQRAISAGIDADTALSFTAKTMEGSARLLLESGKSPKELCKQVCSPGGTTLASLSAFEDLNFDGLMLEAMDRCTKRSKELGK